ncbi:MAG: flippase [Lachnospiraceae bacterium]|nr:flippase [Lachnospiraceae bacterium]
MIDKWKMRLRNELVSNIIWSFLAKVIAMVFYFIADIFYARFLGIDMYAEWVFFFSVANMAFHIGWFGINISSKVHITNSSNKDHCLGAALGVRIFISSIILLTIYLAAPFLAGKIGYPHPYPNLKNLLFVMGLMVFFNSFTEFFKHFYIGTQKLKRLCAITFIEYSAYCIFSVSFLYLNDNPTSIAFGYCVAGVIILICNILTISQNYNGHSILQGIIDLQLQKKILKYAIPLVLTSIGSLVLMEMDTFMLGLFGTKQQVSTYSIAKQLVSKATNVNMAIWTGTVASLAMITKENFYEKKNKFKKVSLFNNAVSIFICLSFALFGGIAIKVIYGKDYIDASNVLYLLIPYYFLSCMASLYANFLDFMGYAKMRALWYISVIVINLTLNYLLIPKYGAVGASIATIVSILPYWGYCVYAVRNIFQNKTALFPIE